MHGFYFALYSCLHVVYFHFRPLTSCIFEDKYLNSPMIIIIFKLTTNPLSLSRVSDCDLYAPRFRSYLLDGSVCDVCCLLGWISADDLQKVTRQACWVCRACQRWPGVRACSQYNWTGLTLRVLELTLCNTHQGQLFMLKTRQVVLQGVDISSTSSYYLVLPISAGISWSLSRNAVLIVTQRHT